MNNKPNERCRDCGEAIERAARIQHVHRGDREIAVPVEVLACPRCADPITGEPPFRFVDPATGAANDARIAEAWRAKYGEPLPKRGRPGRRTEAKRTERVQVLLAPEEVAEIDRLRGDLTRSDYLRRAGLRRR